MSLGVTWDGVFYLRGAREILEGSGYSSTHFPPLTSALLALSQATNADSLMKARWFYASLFGISASAFGVLIFCSTKSALATLVGMLLLISSQSVFPLFTEITSEASFFLLFLLSTYLLNKYLETNKLLFLITASFSAGLSFLSRFAGIAIILSVILSVIFINKNSHLKRFTSAVTAGLIFVLVISPYLIWNMLKTGAFSSRTIEYHPSTYSEFQSMFHNIIEWVVPDRIISQMNWGLQITLIIFVTLGLVALYFLGARKTKVQNNSQGEIFLRILLIFIFVYVPFLIISKTIFDEDIDFNTRQLSPIFVVLVLICLYITTEFIRQQNKPFLWVIASSVSVVMIILYMFPFITILDNNHRDGIGYTNVSWKNSATMNYVSSHSSNQLIYTNLPLAVELYTGKIVREIPRKLDGINKEMWRNENYSREMIEMVKNIQADDGVIVHFYTSYDQGFPTQMDLETELSLNDPITLNDGAIYKFDN